MSDIAVFSVPSSISGVSASEVTGSNRNELSRIFLTLIGVVLLINLRFLNGSTLGDRDCLTGVILFNELPSSPASDCVEEKDWLVDVTIAFFSFLLSHFLVGGNSFAIISRYL